MSVDPTRAEVEALPDPSDALAISALSYQECIDVRPRQTECAEPTPAPTEGQGWLCATEPALTQQEVDAWNARVQEVYRQHAADQGIGVEDYRRQAEAAPAGS